MTTTATHTFVGPLIANGTTMMPFDFQAITTDEVGVTKDGVELFSGYSVALAPDGTGNVQPLSDWGTSIVYIFSRPAFTQETNFSRSEPFYPDALNYPFDTLGRQILALRSLVATRLPLTGGIMTGPLNVPDEIYSSAWNGKTEVPTKNALWDKIETMGGTWGNITGNIYAQTDLMNQLALKANLSGGNVFTGDQTVGGNVAVADHLYGLAWNGSNQVPTKNAVYDKIESIIASIPTGGGVSDGAYPTGWNGDTLTAPSRNAVYDQMELRLPAAPYPGYPTWRAIPLDGVGFPGSDGSAAEFDLFAPRDASDTGGIAGQSADGNSYWQIFSWLGHNKFLFKTSDPVWFTYPPQVGDNFDEVLTTATGLEVSEDPWWGAPPGSGKMFLGSSLAVGDAFVVSSARIASGGPGYGASLELDHPGTDGGCAITLPAAGVAGPVYFYTYGIVSRVFFNHPPLVGNLTDPDPVASASEVLTSATGLVVSEDTWWGSSTGQVAKMFLGESFAVGDAYAEGSARLFKGFSGFNGPGLGLDQKWPSPSTPAGGFQITIPETGNGPVVFQTYNGLTGGYQFDGVLTVDSPLGAEIDFSVDGVVSAAIVNDSAGLYALAPSYFEVMNAATEVQWARIDATGINIPAGATYKVNGVPIGGGSGAVDDTVYGTSWDGVTTIAPSKNAVYDKIQSLILSGGAGIPNGDAGDVVVTGSGAGLTVESATPASGVFNVTGSVRVTGGDIVVEKVNPSLWLRGDAVSTAYANVLFTGRDGGCQIYSGGSAFNFCDAAGGASWAALSAGQAQFPVPTINFGPSSGPVADLYKYHNCTNYYHADQWSAFSGGSSLAMCAYRLLGAFGVRMQAYSHEFRNLSGSHTYAVLDDTGATFSVAGVAMAAFHSQGIRVNNATSSSFFAGSAAAPADVSIYFDTTNYYNILTFRKWDGTAYSTHASIVGSATNGLSLGGYPGYIFYAGSSTAPTTVGTLDTTGLHITGDVKASNGVHGNSGNATNATNRNPGLYSYNNAGDVTAGMELGYSGVYGYTNRIFAHPSWAITLCGITGGGFLQSHFEDWAVVSAGGINLPAGSTYKINGVAIGGGGSDPAKANLAGGNAFTGAQSIAASGAPLTINSTNSNGNKITLQDAGVNVSYLAGYAASPFEVSDATGTPFFTVNQFKNVLVYNNLGVTGYVSVADAAYSSAWNGDLSVPTKNAVYDKIEAIVASGGGVSSFNTRTGAVTLTGGDVNAALGFAPAADVVFTSGARGLAPLSGGGAVNFLRADGTWAAPAGNGNTTNALTIGSSGGGAPGTTFNGSAARTIDYSTVGAAKAGTAITSLLTMNTAKIIGRTTASAGALEEITPGATMTLTAGALNVASVPNALTGNNSGTGVASGGTYNGSAAVTFSWNTLGAAPDAPRIQAAAAESITPTFSNDVVQRLACVASITLNNPTGTAVDGWGLVVRLRSASAQALSYGTQYRAVGVVLPAATIAGKLLILGMIWNVTDTKFDVVAVAQEA